MPVDARIRKSTESILRAGLELLNENKDAKLTDVAIQAGVGRATLYRLFKNKDDLVVAITQYCFDEFEKAIQPIEEEAKSAIHAIELLFHYTMPLTLESNFLSKIDYFLNSHPDIEKIEKLYRAKMLLLIEEVSKEIVIDKQLSPSWLLNLIEGLFYAGWLQQTSENFSSEQAATLAYLCFSKSIK